MARSASRYNDATIQSIRHQSLDAFFCSGKTSGVQPSHLKRLRLQLAILDTAQDIPDLDIPGFGLHRLKGTEQQRWSIKVNANWRLTFEFEDGDVYLLVLQRSLGSFQVKVQ